MVESVKQNAYGYRVRFLSVESPKDRWYEPDGRRRHDER